MQAAGFDLSAVKNVQIGPGESTVVGTGIVIKDTIDRSNLKVQ